MAKVTNSDGSRWYTHRSADGKETERYLSVTTIIDLGVPKPALIGWAAKATAEAAVDKRRSVDAILRDIPDGLEGEALEEARADQRAVAVKMLTGARFQTTSKAALTGSHVHEAIEAHKLERPYPGVPKKAEPWYLPFLQMFEDHAPIFLQTEANVFNRTRRYAGTLDSVGVWPSLGEAVNPKTGELWFPKPWKDERGPVLVNDYKTGKGPRKGGVWPEVALQMSAYGNAEFIDSPEGEVPMPEVDGAVAIHLQPGFYELIPVDISEQVFNCFLFAYEVARWQLYGSKEVIGKPIGYGEVKAALDGVKAEEVHA